VTDTSRTLAATAVGAVLGGLAGYLFLTERGRALRAQLEPALDEAMRELSSLRHTLTKAGDVAGEGWRLLDDTIGEGRSPRRFAHPQQTSPF
jgi:hypothetical protein